MLLEAYTIDDGRNGLDDDDDMGRYGAAKMVIPINSRYLELHLRFNNFLS